MKTTTSSEWLSLSDAAALMGVHPGTVRVWSDKGLLPVHKTKGGHRRYRRDEVELWLKAGATPHEVDPAEVMGAAVRQIRVRIAEGRLEAEPWYQKLDEEARTQYRQGGASLMQSLMASLASNGENAEAEAYAVGYEYASRAQRYGLKSADAARAFLFFRNNLMEAIVETYQKANVPSGQAWGEMLRKVNAFTDLILLNLLQTYQTLEDAKP
jgi:excisionase family DNA binding protein